MMKLQSISGEYQRRPTRIIAGITDSICDTSNSSKSRLATSSNNTSRLKCSTITKVPPANKSRIKQHILGNIQTVQQNDPNQSKFSSKLAKPTIVHTRPKSLALRSSQDSPTTRKTLTKVSCTTASTLPKLQIKHDSTNYLENNNIKKSTSRLSSSSESTSTGNTNSSLNGGKTQNIIKRKTSIIRQGAQTISTSSKSPESRLSGLKNLVAVVHPQHSQQRVNSSATTTATTSVKKFCSQTITATTPTTTSTSKLSLPGCLTTKIRSGKLNSNHKDVNAKGEEERRECKQNEFNLVHSRQQQKQQLKTKSNVPPAHQLSNGFTLNSTAPTSASTTSTISTYTTSANNDQFAHSNNSTGHLLSVASNDCDYHDKKQHENSKQSRNYSSDRKIHSTSITSQPDECKNENNWRTNNCYNHESAGLTLTKSPLIYSKHNTNIAHSIDNYILPKPMGQQVLSLMMLDVGLMPAHYNQQYQPIQSTERSHVCLPSLSRQSFVNEKCANSLVYDQTSIHDHENSCPTAYDNIFSRNHTKFQQCNDYHSLQLATDGMFNLQLELPNLNSRNPKSISLPSSPSMRTRNRYPQKFNRKASSSHKTADSDCQSTQFLEHEYPTMRGISPVSFNSERSRNTNRLLTVFDSQDSQSVTSSSCSSLKQCPPLLALSNQLEGFKLDELVKAKRDTIHKSDMECFDKPKSEMDYDKAQSPDQTSLVVEQHKILINNPSSNQKEKDQLSESDQVEECYERLKNSFENDLNSRAQDACELKQYLETHKNKPLCKDDRSDHQLRRQQQPRSHSISGQEFYSNGSYGRLKQSLYNPKNAQELYQSYNSQLGNRVHQTQSPFQPLNVLGRSPSPSSISSHINYSSSPHDGSFKHSHGRPVKSNLHASLECLNSNYPDYQPQFVVNNNNSHQHQQQHQYINQQNSQYPQQQNYHMQNQHYAASYLPAPPPANTIINQNGDQDLAAAAMGNPLTHFQQKSHLPNINSYNYQTQNLINRAMTQISQSPLRRAGLNTPVNNGIPAGIISHLTSSHHPMRAGHSSLSLASSSFLIEDKLQNEIRKLQSELKSEKEKAEALNSQLNINSSLMAAFEQSLTTLNTRLRQLTTLNEKKDKEIEDLRDQLDRTKFECYEEQQVSSDVVSPSSSDNTEKQTVTSEKDTSSERCLNKVIEDLKRQLIEKDRILTDTRLEALSAAHQLEQLESKLNGEHSLLVNEDDLDEGVMVVNHSPSDSDAITDSTHFNEMSGKSNNSKQKRDSDNSSFRQTNYNGSPNNQNENNNNITDSSPETNYTDNQSNNSSDCLIDMRDRKQHNLNTSVSQQFNNGSDSGLVGVDYMS